MVGIVVNNFHPSYVVLGVDSVVIVSFLLEYLALNSPEKEKGEWNFSGFITAPPPASYSEANHEEQKHQATDSNPWLLFYVLLPVFALLTVKGGGVSPVGPDRKKMWEFWSIFSLEFDSLALKHILSHCEGSQNAFFMPYSWLSKWRATWAYYNSTSQS